MLGIEFEFDSGFTY